MKVDENRVTRNIDLAFDVFQDVLAHPERYPEDVVVFPLENLLDQASPFSQQRLRIVQFLRQHGGVDSLDQLAAGLGRELTRLSKDVSYLEELGLVKCERHGRRKSVRATKARILLA